ncbi:MAG: D-2-hydroxyacid dehydrogenase [Candidatus Bathyarchaeia archaeon]
MPRVLICDKLDEEGINLLREAGFEVDVKLDHTPETLKEAVKDYDAVIVRSRTKITKEIIAAMDRTKVVARAGVGLDNIDVQAAKEKGLKVINSPEAVSQATAELSLALLFSLIRQIPYANLCIKGGEWPKSKIMGRELKGKTLGIIGFGRVGYIVAKVAKAIGMRVIAYDVVDKEAQMKELGVEKVTLEELLKDSDVISLHATLTPQSRHLIGRRELSMVKRGAILVNTARGSLVDEEALKEALTSGQLAGAAIDVCEVEPPQKFDLLRLPNVVCTPHIGAQTEEAQKHASLIIAKKVIEELKR